MLPPLVAQLSLPGTLAHWVIVAILCAGVIGIGLVVLRQTGVVIPPWVVNIAWIVAVVIVAILAIRLIFSFA